MKYYKSIIFSKTKFEEYFKYKDEFQIYPLKSEYLDRVKKYKHHPIVIEFKIEDSEWMSPKKDFSFIGDIFKKEDYELLATSMTKLDRLIDLINLFSTNLFFRYKNNDGFWTIPATSDKTEDEIRSIEHSDFLYKFFFLKNFKNQCIIDDFNNDIAKEFNEIPLVNYNDYFSNDPNYDYNVLDTIKFPNVINYGLEGYFDLNAEEKKIIDTSIKYSNICMKNLESETTIGALSAFTSIETLMNFYYKDFKPENCKECGQSRYSIAKRYTDFLLYFVGESDDLKKEYKKLYTFRSKIVHTGFSFATENLWHDMEEEKADDETIRKLQIMMVNKRLIINYLSLTKLEKKEKHQIASINS